MQATVQASLVARIGHRTNRHNELNAAQFSLKNLYFHGGLESLSSLE